MAKLKSDPITQADLKAYIKDESDFAFELKVLKLLFDKSVDCEHGGHYEDPVEGKSREFDIRARFVSPDSKTHVSMAVECKNIRENFPVHISCVPRRPEEAYHYIALANMEGSEIPRHYPRSAEPVKDLQAVCLRNSLSMYRAKGPVGKSTAQVGRDSQGKITANDSGLFEKWGQALASLHDLIAEFDDEAKATKEPRAFVALPIVVVPNDRLWMTKYNIDGSIFKDPEPIDRVSAYAGKNINLTGNFRMRPFIISHMEFMTVKGLERFIADMLHTESGIELLLGL